MRSFAIKETDKALSEALIDKINNLTKPKGSLGLLEKTDRVDTAYAFPGVEEPPEYYFCCRSRDCERRG